MATAVAGLVGLVPTVLVASPASADADDLTITVAPGPEGNNVRFTITREAGGVGDRTLTYATADDPGLADATTGAAQAGKDYTPAAGTLTFLGADTGSNDIKHIDVPATPDLLDEFNEKFTLVVTEGGVAATFASGSPANLIGTITDDPNDQPPSYTLTATPSTVAEPAAGSATSTISAKLSAASGKPVTINLSTDDGTAKADDDFTPLNAVPLTFQPGDLEETTTVSVLSDGTDDVLETEAFSVNGTGTNVSPATRSVNVNISDRDATPKVTITGGGPVAEDTPAEDAEFTVELDRPSEQDVTVHWDVVAADAVANHGVANPTEDFVSYPNSADRTVTIPAGDTDVDILIPIKDDDIDEVNPEDFAVQLSAPTNAGLGTTVKLAAQIADNADDLPPNVSITPEEVDEGDSGRSSKTFTATLDAKSGRPVTVKYSTSIDGVAGLGKAAPGRDYVSKTGTLTFPTGVTTQTFTVDVIGDTIDEGTDETFDISLSDVDGTATLDDGDEQSNVVTINDDDDAPTFTFGDIVQKEGDGASAALLPVTLSGTTSDRVISFVITDALVGGTDNAEPAGSGPGSDDYDLIGAPQTVTISPETTTGYGVVLVKGDEIFETDETTHFQAAPAGGMPVSGSAKTAKFTIENDDVAPDLEINSTKGNEGDTVEVTGTVTGMAEMNVTANVTFFGGSSKGSVAASANDFTNPGAKLIPIEAGTLPGTVLDVADIALTDDAAAEPAETIIANGVGVNNIGTVTEGIITIAASDGWTPGPSNPGPTNPPTKPPAVKQNPTLTGGSMSRGSATLTVTSNPKWAGYRFLIQRKYSTGWRTVVDAKLMSTGTYKKTLWSQPRGATVQYRAFVYGNSALNRLAGYSAVKAVTIRR